MRLFPYHLLKSSGGLWRTFKRCRRRIKALKEAQEQTEAELKRLEQAILEKAFRGEL
jgi:hypothetical protein